MHTSATRRWSNSCATCTGMLSCSFRAICLMLCILTSSVIANTPLLLTNKTLEIHLLSLCPMKGLFVKICTERVSILRGKFGSEGSVVGVVGVAASLGVQGISGESRRWRRSIAPYSSPRHFPGKDGDSPCFALACLERYK